MKRLAYDLKDYFSVDWFSEEFISLAGIEVLIDIIKTCHGQRNLQVTISFVFDFFLKIVRRMGGKGLKNLNFTTLSMLSLIFMVKTPKFSKSHRLTVANEPNQSKCFFKTRVFADFVHVFRRTKNLEISKLVCFSYALI